MDSRQQTINYLMVEASELSKLCAEALLPANKTKADAKIELQVAVVLSAIKESIEQLKFNEERMMAAAEKEQQRREKEL